MATKNRKKGQFAPVSKHGVMVEIEKSAHLIGAVIGITAWFIAIWLAAVGIGFVVHWTDVHWTWVPDHMITAGHVLEYFIFGVDCISLLWSVGFHFFHHLKGEVKSEHNGTE